MVCAVMDEAMTKAQAARRFKTTAKTVAKWLGRFRAEGIAGLADRSSRPHSSPSQTPWATGEAVEVLRRARCTQDHIAQELAADALLPDAGKAAHKELHKVLDGAQVRYAEQIKKARKAVLTVEGKSVKTDLKIHEMSFDDFVEAADYAVIEDAYRRSARSISSDLATTYSEHLAREADSGELEEDALIEAHTTIAAIGLVDDIKEQVESEAEKLAKQWLNKYRVQIKSLSDERLEVYRQIREMSTDPLDVDLARPNTWIGVPPVRWTVRDLQTLADLGRSFHS